MGRILLGVLLGFLLAPLLVLAWLRYGDVPVAVADAQLPYERQIVSIPIEARIRRDKINISPIPIDETNLVEGARIYSENCASCHGFHGKPSLAGARTSPQARPLWEKRSDSNAIGVSDIPPGENYWKIANGIRLTSMPAHKDVLTETEMWQVSLLLSNADKPLPPKAVSILLGDVAPAHGAPAHGKDDTLAEVR